MSTNVITPKIAPEHTPAKPKSKPQSITFLEKVVAKTIKLKVEHLLDIYSVYEDLVFNVAVHGLLLPHTRYAKSWILDQARDLLTGSDRNRIILSARARKQAEAEADTDPRWPAALKPKHRPFVRNVLQLMHEVQNGRLPSADSVRDLGLSRLVADDLGSYFICLTNNHPIQYAEWCDAYFNGDDQTCLELYNKINHAHTEIGISNDDAWYVTVHMRGVYDLIDEIINTITLAYSRLLFKFAHRLRGITSTEENFSAGYEGLIRAARNYDPLDGSSFTVHCQWWVRSAVLHRQRQSSVIVLPSTVWYQLSLLNRGKLADAKIDNVKQLAEMFYASSANAVKVGIAEEDADDITYEAIVVGSPDASVVLGDGIEASQRVFEGLEQRRFAEEGSKLWLSALTAAMETDPGLVLPVLLWALHSGMDATMLAEYQAPMFLDGQARQNERNRHVAKTAQMAQHEVEKHGKRIEISSS